MITAYHGTASQHKALKASQCELGFPKGVWLTDSFNRASRYASRHVGGGYVAEVAFDSATIADFETVRDGNRECPVTTARRARRQGYAGISFDGMDVLIFKPRAASLTITGYHAPATLTAGAIAANRCSCH